MINIALIGRGYWGSKLEGYIKKNLHMKLVVVCDLASNLDKEVYKNPKVQAVFVVTPDQTHYQIVKHALMHEKHVMCEKPMAFTKKQCLELEQLARKNNVVLCVDYTHTFSQSVNFAVDLAKKGVVGKIQGMQMQMKQLGPFDRKNVYWLSASHMLAILDMFISLKKITFYKKDMVVKKGNVETGVIYFSSGNFSGQIFSSLNYPQKERGFTLYGQKGTITYNPLLAKSLQLVTYKRELGKLVESSVVSKFFAFDDSRNLKNVVEYFFEVIQKKRQSNIKRAVLVTQILENLHG